MKYVVIGTWDDAPHLSEEAKASFIASIRPEQRAARTKGIPFMGAGLVYAVEEADIVIQDFPIPDDYYHCYGLDTGWNWNGAVWMAHNKETDIAYLYRAYKRGAAEPAIIASAIQSSGKWIPGVADAADINRTDGVQYIELYKKLGLDIELPDKTFETGIQEVWSRLSTGRLKVFASCQEWFSEYRIYSRNEKGQIKSQTKSRRNELMDATRYAIMSGLKRARKRPSVKKEWDLDWNRRPSPLSWMGS